MDLTVLRSLFGIFALLAIAMFLSKKRKAIDLRTVGWAFLLQLSLGAFVLYIPFGKDVLASISGGVQQVIDSANIGIAFFYLAD